MAQNYEIDIKRFNGQDYDTLLPTPASHASTHQANGSDPLTLQAGNYGSLSIPTSAYQNASVTRGKLTNDALYSPVITISANVTLASSHIGATCLLNSGGNSLEVLFDNTTLNALPVGTEIAFVRWMAGNCVLKFSGNMTVVTDTDGQVKSASQAELSLTAPTYNLFALKKMSNTDILVTGNVEVS